MTTHTAPISSRTALLAAQGAVLAWTCKSVAIGTAGGLGRSPLESPLFFLGLACYTVGAVALAVALTRGRAPGWRVLAGLLAEPAGFAVGAGLDAAAFAVRPDGSTHWAWAEVGLWVMAVALLAVTTVVHGRRAPVQPVATHQPA